MALYPQHEKLAAVHAERLAISEFCEYLQANEYLQASDTQIREWIAGFFGINQQEFECEKVEMLAALRKANLREATNEI